MNENWKTIAGYTNYEVSNLGNVKSLKRGKERILIPVKSTYGYLQVFLCKDGHVKKFYVHRLVAQAFIPNPNPEHFNQVNHIDEVKTNNSASNLEWCDRKYNNNYGTRNARISKRVLMFDKQGNLLAEFPSAREAHRVTGISCCNISECCNGKQKSSGGYIWRFGI